MGINNYLLYESMVMPDPHFPIKVFKAEINNRGPIFPRHWHESIELLYFMEGSVMIECSQQSCEAGPGDLIVVNSCELHQGDCIRNGCICCCIILDTSLLAGPSEDICNTRYVSPIAQSQMIFNNKITGNRCMNELIQHIFEEYELMRTGYELEIKSSIGHLFTDLMRNHMKKALSPEEYDLKLKNHERFNEIFKLIESDYTNKITLRQCAGLLNITDSHFCHLFKLITGKTLSAYINNVRLKKAETLLKNTDLPMTEIALSTGFNDTAYFTRLFTGKNGLPPSQFRIGTTRSR